MRRNQWRDEQIVAARKRGVSGRVLAAHYALSVARIYQIETAQAWDAAGRPKDWQRWRQEVRANNPPRQSQHKVMEMSLSKRRTMEEVEANMAAADDDFGDDGDDLFERMDSEIAAAYRLLPAWFTARMMGDNWFFGLLLVTGQTLCIRQIEAVHQGPDGTVWLDVEMDDTVPYSKPPNPLIAPTTRVKASVNAAHIVTAFETSDT